MPPSSGPSSTPKAKSKFADIVNRIKELLEQIGILKEKPLPQTHAKAADWLKCRSFTDAKGVIWYEVPETVCGIDADKNGTLEPGIAVDMYKEEYWIAFYTAQIKAYSEDINAAEKEIEDYKQEINNIENHISKLKSTNTRKHIRISIWNDQISALESEKQTKLDNGALPTDIDIISLEEAIKKIEDKIDGEKLVKDPHVGDWYETPYTGAKVLTNINLYNLINSHRKHIKNIKKTKLKYAKTQLDRSAWHKYKWRRQDNKKYK